jgi:hypothetical protein
MMRSPKTNGRVMLELCMLFKGRVDANSVEVSFKKPCDAALEMLSNDTRQSCIVTNYLLF